jgi:hypothetical protein
MSPQRQPQWQPISSLPLLATMIDGMLESAQENHLNLKAARHRPHLLDDYTVNRVIKTYTDQQDDLWFYEEQFARWRSEDLDPDQRHEVERLSSRIERLKLTLEGILLLAGELKEGTIERVLNRSDENLARDLLSGKGTS